jgi:L-ribulokinase
MTGIKEISYRPIAANQAVYEKLYALYRDLHDAFGGVTQSANLGHVMKDLLTLKAAVN